MNPVRLQMHVSVLRYLIISLFFSFVAFVVICFVSLILFFFVWLFPPLFSLVWFFFFVWLFLGVRLFCVVLSLCLFCSRSSARSQVETIFLWFHFSVVHSFVWRSVFHMFCDSEFVFGIKGRYHHMLAALVSDNT